MGIVLIMFLVILLFVGITEESWAEELGVLVGNSHLVDGEHTTYDKTANASWNADHVVFIHTLE